MNKYYRKILVASALLGIVFAIILLIYRGQYKTALIVFVLSWAMLFVAGAYGVPLYVKRIILKYVDSKNGEASKSEIISYCSSINKHYSKEAVEKWLNELESKNKIKITEGSVIKQV